MLLYTKNANNVFGFVYDFFGDRNISPVPTPSRASPLPQENRSVTRFVGTINHCGGGLAPGGVPTKGADQPMHIHQANSHSACE
ncbi:hypothetical protein D3C85_1745760 [compost metagenome]